MTIENELDYDDMAQVNYATARWSEIRALIIAGRKAFDTFSLPEEEQKALDEALEKFADVVPYENEPKKSTAVRKDVQRPIEEAHVASVPDRKPGEVDGRTRALPVSNQASPVDTHHKPKKGRPFAGFDKTAYMKKYMRKRRQEDKYGQSAKR